MNPTKAFLLFAAIGLTPIALGYGAIPGVSMQWLFGIDASSVNASHIFRAVMGLYFGLALLWTVGAFNPRLQAAALWSLAVFMLGLAAGRAISLILDGLPHPLLVIYLVLEVIMGVIALMLIRKSGAHA